MRPVKLVLLVLLTATCSRAQWPYIPIVQSQSNGNNGASVTCPFNRNVTTGNNLIVVFGWATASGTPSVSDTLTSTWTQNFFNTANADRVAVYSAPLTSSGADTITISETSATNMSVTCMEFPANWSLTVDASAISTFSGTPSTVTSPSITTTLNSDLIIAFSRSATFAGLQLLQNGSMGTWFTTGSNGGGVFTAFRVGATAGSGNTVTWDSLNSTAGVTVSVAFKSNSIAITNPTAAPNGDTTSAYSYTMLAAGGSGSYTWSVTSGALPTGLSINSSTGAITGTATVSNNYSAGIHVTDGTNSTTKTITFKITTGLSSVSLKQGTSISSGTGGASLTFGSNVATGNVLLVYLGYNSGGSGVGYCTDTIGNAFQTVALWTIHSTASFAVLGNTQFQAAVSSGSGADTITCDGSLIAIGELTNGSNFVGNDNTAVTRGSNTSPATITGSVTNLVPNEFLFGSCSGQTNSSTHTLNSPFTLIGTSGLAALSAYDVATSVTSYTMSCNEASNSDLAWVVGLMGVRPGNGTVVPPSGRGPKGKIL